MKRNKLSQRKLKRARFYDTIAQWITKKAGSPAVSLGAFVLIILWAVTGPVFGFSDTWQLVINTGTTIITFLMVFVIQHSQNKDTRAMQIKLNELIRAMKGASNRLIDIEELSDEELEHLSHRFRRDVQSAPRIRADDPSPKKH